MVVLYFFVGVLTLIITGSILGFFASLYDEFGWTGIWVFIAGCLTTTTLGLAVWGWIQ